MGPRATVVVVRTVEAFSKRRPMSVSIRPFQNELVNPVPQPFSMVSSLENAVLVGWPSALSGPPRPSGFIGVAGTVPGATDVSQA